MIIKNALNCTFPLNLPSLQCFYFAPLNHFRHLMLLKVKYFWWWNIQILHWCFSKVKDHMIVFFLLNIQDLLIDICEHIKGFFLLLGLNDWRMRQLSSFCYVLQLLLLNRILHFLLSELFWSKDLDLTCYDGFKNGLRVFLKPLYFWFLYDSGRYNSFCLFFEDFIKNFICRPRQSSLILLYFLLSFYLLLFLLLYFLLFLDLLLLR